MTSAFAIGTEKLNALVVKIAKTKMPIMKTDKLKELHDRIRTAIFSTEDGYKLANIMAELIEEIRKTNTANAHAINENSKDFHGY